MRNLPNAPLCCKTFFEKIQKFFGKDTTTCSYVQEIVLAIAFLFQPKSNVVMSSIDRFRRSRQSFDKFFNRDSWSCQDFLATMALVTLRSLGWREGEPLCVVIDDTQIEKRGKKMEGVSKTFLHSEKRFADAHTVVTCALVYNGFTIPYGMRLFLSEQAFAQLATKDGWTKRPKMTELAAELIASLRLPTSSQIVVLFDKYYLASNVVEACVSRGYYYIGGVKENRLFAYREKAPKSPIKGIVDNLIKWQGKRVKIEGSSLTHRIAQATGWLKKVGKITLVCSRRKNEKRILTLATNATFLTGKEVVKIYRDRWNIEVLFKSAKQYLGMGDYQLLKYRAVEKHLHLVMCAHCLLTHQTTLSFDEKEKKYRESAPCRVGIYKAKIMFQNRVNNDVLIRIVNSKRYKGRSFITILKKLELMIADNEDQAVMSMGA